MININSENIDSKDARKLKWNCWSKKIILETRIINKNAVDFYKRNNYIKICNYGKYAGRKEAICFEKELLGKRDDIWMKRKP